MESFVAYFDIFGAKDMASRGKFSHAHSLDFTGTVIRERRQHERRTIWQGQSLQQL